MRARPLFAHACVVRANRQGAPPPAPRNRALAPPLLASDGIPWLQSRQPRIACGRSVRHSVAAASLDSHTGFPSSERRVDYDAVLDTLSSEQREVIDAPLGAPLLVNAGPGSGKTRVLVVRVADLVQRRGVKPWTVVAITFTNRAAVQLKQRLQDILGDRGNLVTACTFHSLCVRTLRRHLADFNAAGRTGAFTIHDQDDSVSLVRTCLVEDLGFDPKDKKKSRTVAKDMQRLISLAKSHFISTPMTDGAEAVEVLLGGGARGEPLQGYSGELTDDAKRRLFVKLWAHYHRRCQQLNAIDFDDLLGLTVAMMRAVPDVADAVRAKYHHVLVDEERYANTAAPVANALFDGFAAALADEQIASEVRHIAERAKQQLLADAAARLEDEAHAPAVALLAATLVGRGVEDVGDSQDLSDIAALCPPLPDHVAQALKPRARSALTKFRCMMFALAVLLRLGPPGIARRVYKLMLGVTGYAEFLDQGKLDRGSGAPSREASERRRENVSVVAQELGAFPDRVRRDDTTEVELASGLDTVVAFLQEAQLQTQGTEEATQGDEDKVTLVTMHAAKGLEYHTVFLCACTDDIVPHYNTDNEPEERRLFYVGATRAERRLLVTFSTLHYLDTHRLTKVSRYVTQAQRRGADVAPVTKVAEMVLQRSQQADAPDAHAPSQHVPPHGRRTRGAPGGWTPRR
ncbi:unnamed protein product [Pedinophyceae sp. YPF-701]|nr:unnamed protein product [Pedinophyceae sp. YPF-701]